MSKNSDTKPPLDLTVELNNIKARLEALEQRLYTINQEPINSSYVKRAV